ncbi:hypothetical protein C172_18186 [Paenibacillus sp. FSL H8-457]|nr:hypothetical protein C172_18186 [Paenibacillus sp. FSL H8-457]
MDEGWALSRVKKGILHFLLMGLNIHWKKSPVALMAIYGSSISKQADQVNNLNGKQFSCCQ